MADLLTSLQSSLGSAFVIERELGGGGMSKVFVATETALKRHVVVKVLAPELAQGLSVERFQREIQLAASLQQANVVPVLSAGQCDGLPYFIMPYIEGESLRARLAQGALPIGTALSILRDVARALEFAHAHGVMHRDIKPDNVLLSGSTAVVTDFGIAKAISASRDVTASGALTQLGTSIGTPAYMAPEQAAGDPATDHRADIYSFGCLAYELLAGRSPFAHLPPHKIVAAHINEVPVALVSLRADVPSPIAQLVHACLAKAPGDRPADAASLLRVLDQPMTTGETVSATRGLSRRSMTIAAVAVLVAGAAGYLATRPSTSGAAAADMRAHTIAVLPFEHRGDTADAYFTEAMTDEVRGKLMSIPGLSVIARGSSNPYRGTTKAPSEIAKELGVRYLLSGTVQLVSSGTARRVVVRPELVEVTADGQPQARWQAPFEAEVRDVVRVQGDIAGRVAEAMQVALGGAVQQQLTAAPTRDAAAYDLYLRAQAAWNHGTSNDRASLERARGLFEQALARDSTMVVAWGHLSRVASTSYNNLTPTAELARIAEVAARRALTLAPDGADGLIALGMYHRIVQGDLEQALSALQRARQAAPNDAQVASELGTVLGDLGRFDDALRELDAATQLDPRVPRPWISRGRLLLRMRRTVEARASAERALALAPTALNAMSVRVLVELAAGDLAAARRVVASVQRDVPRERVVSYLGQYWDLGWVLDADDQRLLLSLGPAIFGDAASRLNVRAQQHGWHGDIASARVEGDSASVMYAAQEREAPNDQQRPVIRGLALAHAGRKEEALASVRRGLALSSRTPKALNRAYYLYISARVALLVGDREQSLAWLRESLEQRYFATPAWVRLDPSFKPLHGDPRFEQLLAEVK